LERDPKQERERNMKILSWMQKAEEVGANGGQKPRSKADAHFNVDKMVNKQLRKEEKRRKRSKHDE
jgi:hypothetical protein